MTPYKFACGKQVTFDKTFYFNIIFQIGHEKAKNVLI